MTITQQPGPTSEETAAPTVDPAVQADLDKIETLTAEVAELKGTAAAKNTEVAVLEKEAGITKWDKIVERLKPVKAAVQSAAHVAATNVAKGANSLMKKVKKTGTDEEGGNTGEGAPANEDEENRPPVSSEEASLSGENTAKELTPEQVEAIEKIAVIREEISNIADQIKNKESQISWLKKKHNLTTMNKIGNVVESNLVAAKKNLLVAKTKTGQGLVKAGSKTKQLWRAAIASAGRAKASVSQKMADRKTATGSAPSGEASAGKDDMYSRYS